MQPVARPQRHHVQVFALGGGHGRAGVDVGRVVQVQPAYRHRAAIQRRSFALDVDPGDGAVVAEAVGQVGLVDFQPEQCLRGPRGGVRGAVRAQHVFFEAVAGGAIAAGHAESGAVGGEVRVDEAVAGAGFAVRMPDFLEAAVAGAVEEQAGDDLRAAAALAKDQVAVAIMVDVHRSHLVDFLVEDTEQLFGAITHAHRGAIPRAPHGDHFHHGGQSGLDRVGEIARAGALSQCRQHGRKQNSFHQLVSRVGFSRALCPSGFSGKRAVRVRDRSVILGRIR
ncbi:hypothetical protein D3C87_1309680 [compost metagenome]